MLERFKKMLKREKGFTLVELLAVIAILAIIVAIAVPTIGNVVGDSEKQAKEANVELFENAAKLANISGKETDTTASSEPAYSLDKLVDDGFLDKVPDVPGTETKYDGKVKVTEVTNGGIKYEYEYGSNEEKFK